MDLEKERDKEEELLNYAEQGDAKKVLELLLQGVGAQYFEELQWDQFPRTALIAACDNGHVDAVRDILEHGKRTQKELEQAFKTASQKGNVQVAQMLLDGGVDPSLEQNGAVCVAAENGHLGMLKLLLSDPRVDPSARGNYAIGEAAHRSDLDTVKLLLQDRRVKPQPYAVHEAALYGQCEMLELFLADSRVDGTCAIANARFGAVRVLIEDERCGVNANRSFFLPTHQREVEKYDELVEERTGRICAVSWCMKQVGQGWGDLREPTEERMSVQSVYLEGK